MGLLFGDTIIHKHTTTTAPEMIAAQMATAEATEHLAEATEGLTDAIKEDKVKITHDRYAELINKSRLLTAISNHIFQRIFIIKDVATSKQYKEYMNTYFMQSKLIKFNETLKEEYAIELHIKDRTVNLYKLNKDKKCTPWYYNSLLDLGYDLVEFIEPEYVKETTGSVNIIGTEYHRLLRDEINLEIYKEALEKLPSILFELLNCDRQTMDYENNIRFIAAAEYENDNKSYYPTCIGFNSSGLNFYIKFSNELKIKKIN